MPTGYAPTVFISSTCYDLAQIRADMKIFIEGLGFDPLLSEEPAFPIDPSVTPPVNCVNAVRDRAGFICFDRRAPIRDRGCQRTINH
jgi:hypothetical protein